MYRILIPLMAAIIMSCGVLDEDYATSGFRNLDSSGYVPISGSNVQRIYLEDPNVGRVAYSTAIDTDDATVMAYAGIQTGYNIGSTVTTTGTAIYNVRYGYRVMTTRDSRTQANTLDALRIAETGTLSLTANFGAGTLTGSNSEIAINGRINGSDLSGRVNANYSDFFLTHGNVTGSIGANLDGHIGTTGVLGAFHGNNSNTAVAGGFVGTP
jgi:hypothetical protein